MIILMSFLFILPVKAETEYVNPENGNEVYLDDSAELLSEEEERLLISEMSRITDYGNCMLVTAYQYDDTDDFARDTYRARYGRDAGTILVIDMFNRIIYIHNEDKVSKVITSAYSNSITDNSYRYATNEEYYQCASSIFSQELTLLQGGKISQPMKLITNILISLLAAVMINFWVLTISHSSEPRSTEPKANTVPFGSLVIAGGAAKMIKEKRSTHVDSSSSGSSGSWSSGGSSGSSGSSGSWSSGSSGGGHRF